MYSYEWREVVQMRWYSKYILVVIVIILSIGGLNSCNNSQQSSTNSDEKEDKIMTISKQQLNEMFATGSTFFLYVGRPTCPDCEIFYPTLEEIANSTDEIIYYYNTEVKASKKSEMKEYMKMLGIEEIPIILKVVNGKIVQYYDGQKDEEIDNFSKEVQGGQ